MDLTNALQLFDEFMAQHSGSETTRTFSAPAVAESGFSLARANSQGCSPADARQMRQTVKSLELKVGTLLPTLDIEQSVFQKRELWWLPCGTQTRTSVAVWPKINSNQLQVPEALSFSGNNVRDANK